jgi:superfamily II helicase
MSCQAEILFGGPFSMPLLVSSGRMVRVEAGPASVDSEGQSSEGTAEKHVGVTLEGSIREPIVDASNLNDKPAKRCSVCGYSKLLVDFEDTVSIEDKRTEVCRACLAAHRARRLKANELYHLELTPEKAWERAKICTKCGVRNEIRDLNRSKRLKDGTTYQCRSCTSNYGKALPVVLPVDTPQRCDTCNEMKPAADYAVHVKKSTGRSKICKLCARKSWKERYLRLKQSNVVVQRHDKVCTSCGQLKLTSEFSRNFISIDGLRHLCRSCDHAQASKARETRAGPPASK